jgi:hypothetical protein
MGIDDRDYMRERYRQRQAQNAGSTWWNERKGRREFPDAGPATGKGGGWFDGANRGFDYQRGRYRPREEVRGNTVQMWIFALSALPTLIYGYREAKRSGWIPDLAVEVPFPASGTVTVNNNVDPRTATSQIKVSAAQANAVVQLFDRSTDEHVISIYVNRNDDASVPVPPGTYRMNIIEGDKWHGLTKWFGSSTTYETVARPMVFTRSSIRMIDLHRTPAGNLHTRINITNPKPLN